MLNESPEDEKTESLEDEKTESLEEILANRSANDKSATSNEELVTENYKLETNMEVHHHPHVEKKNFKEYFLEFLMIFLAVTMGFFAESIR
jgi:cell division protein FtsB